MRWRVPLAIVMAARLLRVADVSCHAQTRQDEAHDSAALCRGERPPSWPVAPKEPPSSQSQPFAATGALRAAAKWVAIAATLPFPQRPPLPAY